MQRLICLLVILVVCTRMYLNHVARLIIINIRPDSSGMGNQMFRYAAGLGFAESNPDFLVCWSAWDWFAAARHSDSFFLHHVTPVAALPECSLLSSIVGELLLERFTPGFSTYVPFVLRAVLVDGAMESFRYFPSKAPVYRLNHFDTAIGWMRARNLTSAIHVRRGDYSVISAPIDFYARNMVPDAVVVTDDPEWVMQHPSVFGHCVVSQGNSPGFDMALLAAATDSVVIGIGTFAWWGAYLSCFNFLDVVCVIKNNNPGVQKLLQHWWINPSWASCWRRRGRLRP
jgi:hypothetical protein